MLTRKRSCDSDAAQQRTVVAPSNIDVCCCSSSSFSFFFPFRRLVRQTLFYLDEPLIVRSGESIKGEFKVKRNASNPRDLDIDIKVRTDRDKPGTSRSEVEVRAWSMLIISRLSLPLPLSSPRSTSRAPTRLTLRIARTACDKANARRTHSSRSLSSSRSSSRPLFLLAPHLATSHTHTHARTPVVVRSEQFKTIIQYGTVSNEPF